MSDTAASPLAGKRVVVTRAAAQGEPLCRELETHGAIPLLLPLIQIVPPEDTAALDAALRGLAQFDWLFLTSQNALRALVDRSQSLGISLQEVAGAIRVAAVGPATAEAAEAAGLGVTHVAKMRQGIALADELGAQVAGRSILLPRSERANPDLPRSLAGCGGRVTEVVAYRNTAPSAADALLLAKIGRGDVDAILFFSPSAVQALAELLGAETLRKLQAKVAFAAIGPVTAASLSAVAIEQPIVAPDATISAILGVLAGHWAQRAPAGAKQA